MTRSFWLVTTAITLTAAQAWAQAVPSVDPGLVQPRFERRERPELYDKSLLESLDLPSSGPELAPGITFTLKEIRLSGATAVAEDKTEALYRDKIGQKVSLQEVQALVQSITDLYRSEGYILSKAILPPQRIGDGVVTIQIIEGSIDQIEFRGEPVEEGVLAAYADKIRASKPLHIADLERYLLLMDDLAGMTARGTLQASKNTQGASDLIITLERRDYDGQISFNNHGSRFIGPYQGDASIAGNNLLGLNEVLGLRSIQSSDLEELHYYEASYAQPLGSDGLKFNLLASFTQTDPGDSLSVFDIEGESTTVLGNLAYPLLRSRRENIFFSGGLLVRNSQSDTLGVQSYEDNIRAVTLGMDYDLLDSLRGINRLSVTLTQGLDALGANDGGDLVSRTNAEADFTKLTYHATRLQSIDNHFGVLLSSHGQLASDELYSSEEFSVGADSFLTAFDPAEITGDHGIAGRLELHFNGDYSNEWIDRYQLYSFIDGAWVYNINALVSEDEHASASSTGLGARFDLLKQLRGEVELALPVSHHSVRDASEEDAGIYFSVS